MPENYGRKEIRETKWIPLRERKVDYPTVMCISMGFGLLWGAVGGGIMQVYNIPPSYAVSSVNVEEVEILEEDKVVYGDLTNRIFRTVKSHIWESDTNENFKLLDIPLSEDLQKFTYYLCNEYGIEYSLVIALMERESKFDINAIGDGVNYGLMQIHTINHTWLSEELGIIDFLDPYQNVQAGIYMLCDLFKKYDNTDQVLMAYNSGESGAKRLFAKQIFSTDYTRNILENALKYYEEMEILL